VLGAVQPERPAAEEPDDDQRGGQDPGRELQRRRKRDERERCEQGDEEDEALAPPRDAATARQWRDRRGELQQAPDERDAAGRAAWARHLAFVELARLGRERPVALAHDHDAVRSRHPAEAGQEGGPVGACERLGDGCVHAPIVVQRGPPGECRTAQKHAR
jgi:hypothetical protein